MSSDEWTAGRARPDGVPGGFLLGLPRNQADRIRAPLTWRSPTAGPGVSRVPCLLLVCDHRAVHRRLLAVGLAIGVLAGCSATGGMADRTGSTPASIGAPSAHSQTPTRTVLVTRTVAATTTAPATAASAPVPTMVVLDASGSMNARDAPGSRIDAAKRAVSELVAGLPSGWPLGLMVYGTGTDSSDAAKAAGCRDVKTLAPVGPLDQAKVSTAIAGVRASGYTPIGAALTAAAAALPASGPRSIVLISDGEDTCAPPDPCAVAKQLRAGGTDLVIHAVGFKVTGKARDQLACLAEAGGGDYVTAAGAEALAARLRVAADPSASLGKLTAAGYAGLRIGMTVAQARSVDPSIQAADSGRVVVVWKDCDLTFADGKLIRIAPRTPVATAEGLAVGDDVTKAEQLYGPATAATEDGRTHAVFAARDGSEVGYDVTFEPSGRSGAPAGKVTSIVVCRCKPLAATDRVSAAPYQLEAGKWWIGSPDGAWHCIIAASTGCRWRLGPQSAPPPMLGPDFKYDTEAGPRPGLLAVRDHEVIYGYYSGDAGDFGLVHDRQVPVLPAGAAVTVGPMECFATEQVFSCHRADGIGFSLSKTGYELYPRDGTAPAGPAGFAGIKGPRPPVIGPDGFGEFKLGMTVDQVRRLNIEVTATGRCSSAKTPSADLTFNPDGRLAYIKPTGTVQTPEGLMAGMTGTDANRMYPRPDGRTTIDRNSGGPLFPVTPGSKVGYQVDFFADSQEAAVDPADAYVAVIVLNGGQQCFN